MPIAATRAWILGADGRLIDELGRPMVPRPRVRHAIIGRRIPKLPLQRTHQSIRRTGARTAGGHQNSARRLLKRYPLGRSQRCRKLNQQPVDFVGARCCHEPALREMVCRFVEGLGLQGQSASLS